MYKKIFTTIAIIIAITSIASPLIMTLNDFGVIEFRFPVNPLIVSLVCLLALSFLFQFLEGE